MAKFPFMQVDAFTDRILGGNPCAILFETDELDDPTMQAIAKENNLSETAFVRKSTVADFGVRYYTPSEEIPLAGHPTIATAHALAVSGRLPLKGPVTTVHFELTVGTIRVDLFTQDNRLDRIVMTQQKPRFMARHQPADIMPAFNLTPEDLLPDAVIQTVSTGTPQLMVPLRDLKCLRRAELQIPVYNRLRDGSDFFSPHLFCLSGVTAEGQTFARHFGTPPDLLEDPFTGSATGGMAAFLWRYRRLEQPKFVAQQGHWMCRPGTAHVEIVGPPEDIEAVKIGGSAVTVIRGEFEL